MPAPTINARTNQYQRPYREPQDVVVLFDDFLGDTFETGTWDAVSLQATGGTDWAYDASAGNPANGGWIQATTGTGDNDAEGVFGPLAFMANRATASQLLVFEARIGLPSVAGVGMGAGLTDARTESASLFTYATTTWTTVPDNGVAWAYDTDGTTDLFRGIGTKATVDTSAVDGVVPVADTPMILRIEIDVAGTAHFYQDNVWKGSKANAVTVTTPLAPFVDVCAKAGSAAKVGECDYILTFCPR